MAPPRVEEYLAELFCGTNVTMQVVSDQETLLQEYPLFACVNRAASMIPRHAGRIIFLTYEPPNPACILETVMLVAKGVTYDTGGTDLKVDGKMFGMSRDKCGAAACAGFMQVHTKRCQLRAERSITRSQKALSLPFSFRFAANPLPRNSVRTLLSDLPLTAGEIVDSVACNLYEGFNVSSVSFHDD